jgi:DHA1 family bicyclomycin/chloramphenicol resistance-like MFS transporter
MDTVEILGRYAMSLQPMSAPRAAPGAMRPKATRGVSLGLLTLLSTFGMLATNLYLPSLPSMARELSTDAGSIRATLTIFLAALAVSQLVVGPLSDRWGRRRVLLAGTILYTFASAACAAASNIEVMLIFRVFQAIGACAASVLVRAIVRDWFEGAELARALAIILTLMTAAPGFSPLLGGFIETTLGWRADFVLLAIFGAGGTLLTWRWIAESNRKQMTVLSLSQLLGEYRDIATTAAFIGPTLATSLAVGGLFAFFASAPAIFIQHLGVSPSMFGVVPAGLVFALFAGGAAAPRLRARFGQNGAILIALSLIALGGAAMSTATLIRPLGPTEIVVPLIFYLGGIGIMNPIATAAALEPFAKTAGAAAALNGFCQMAGATFGTLLLGLFPLPFGLPATLMICAIAALSVFVLCTALRHSTQSAISRTSAKV